MTMAQTKIRPIRSEAEYDAALREIEHYFDKEPKPGSPESDRFDMLALVIGDYEKKRWPIEAPNAIKSIKYRINLSGFRQTDLAKLIGSRSRASEILNLRRPMTLDVIWMLVTKWAIPAESLIKPYKLKAELRPQRHKRRARAAA